MAAPSVAPSPTSRKPELPSPYWFFSQEKSPNTPNFEIPYVDLHEEEDDKTFSIKPTRNLNSDKNHLTTSGKFLVSPPPPPLSSSLLSSTKRTQEDEVDTLTAQLSADLFSSLSHTSLSQSSPPELKHKRGGEEGEEGEEGEGEGEGSCDHESLVDGGESGEGESEEEGGKKKKKEKKEVVLIEDVQEGDREEEEEEEEEEGVKSGGETEKELPDLNLNEKRNSFSGSEEEEEEEEEGPKVGSWTWIGGGGRGAKGRERKGGMEEGRKEGVSVMGWVMGVVKGGVGVLLRMIYSIILFFFLTFRLNLLARRFCPDLYWAMVRPVRARSDYDDLKGRVLGSKAVNDAIGFEAQKMNNNPLHTLKGVYIPRVNKARLRKAEDLFDAMAAKPSVPLLRCMFYILGKLWRFVYPLGVHVGENEIQPVLAASKKGVPLLFLPTHKSHVDYLLVTYLAFEYALPIPYVVTGDNLNIPFIGSILRSCGAFFIPRSFAGEDTLSAAIFGEYIKALLEGGHSIECFIEGGRSRTGKVLQPKTGMLARVIEWALEEREVVVLGGKEGERGQGEGGIGKRDLAVVPISLTYDRIVENAAHIEELSGGSKKPERFSSSVRGISGVIASSFMNVTCYGRVDIRVAKPFGLQDYIERLSCNGRYVGLSEKQKRKHLAMSVGCQTLFLCNKVSVAEPAAMVATILLTHCKRGITRAQLRKDVAWLRDLILAHDGRVVSLRPEHIDVVLNLILGPIHNMNELVKQHKELLMVDLYSPKERMELSLYQNQIIHHFVQAGIVSLVLYKHDKHHLPDSSSASSSSSLCTGNNGEGFIKVKDLFGDVKFLSSLLKFEFIFPPSSDLEKNIRSTISFLVDRQVLEWKDIRRETVGVYHSKEAMEIYLFYATLFWRFLDSYWLVCLGFYYLLPNRVLSESLLVKYIQSSGENLYFQGQLDLFEAIAKETVLNSLSLFINWKVVEHLTIEGVTLSGQISHNPGKRVLRLTPEYQNEAKLEELVATIGSYRKSLRAYRSRRFLIRHKSETHDAINIVKRDVQSMRKPSA